MATDIRKLISEPSFFLLALVSLLLIKLTFPTNLGTEIITVYGTMLFGAFMLWSIGSDIRSQSGNTAQSLLYAGISLGALFVVYLFVQFLFKQSVIPLETTGIQTSQGLFQTVFQSFTKFGELDVDFSKLTFTKFYLFGFLIPILETVTLSRIYGFTASLTNITISDFKSPRNWALILLIAFLFMFFHLKVRGINNNVDLAITFMFGVATLYLVGRFKEVESANYLHIGWNTMALIFGG